MSRGITRDQATQILEEVKEIRHLLEKQTRPGAPTPLKTVQQTRKVRIDGGFSLGPVDGSGTARAIRENSGKCTTVCSPIRRCSNRSG
jgi:hypothetical protein